jgi:hypothetical protein
MLHHMRIFTSYTPTGSKSILLLLLLLLLLYCRTADCTTPSVHLSSNYVTRSMYLYISVSLQPRVSTPNTMMYLYVYASMYLCIHMYVSMKHICIFMERGSCALHFCAFIIGMYHATAECWCSSCHEEPRFAIIEVCHQRSPSLYIHRHKLHYMFACINIKSESLLSQSPRWTQ